MLYILIRHGQCITNLDRNYAVASNDEDLLTEKGCDQALKTARFLNKLRIEKPKITTSTLARAKQTADIIYEALNLNNKIFYSDLLIEKGREESYSDSYLRYKSLLEKFVDADNRTLVIITHGHLLQSVFANLIGSPKPEVLDFHNCSISAYENERVLTINSYFHLLNQ